MSDTKKIAIRTFENMDAIRELPGFEEDNPVTIENYEDLYGDYHFPETVKCCRQKQNLELCKTDHQIGFAVKLKDGSASIVGNICADKRFGIDTKIRADSKRYINEKNRKEKFEALKALLSEKATGLAFLESLNVKVQKIEKALISFKLSLGEKTAQKLKERAKNGNNTVFVDVITFREHTNEDGDTEKERIATPTRLGVLKGLKIFNGSTFKPINSTVREIMTAYADAENEITNKKMKTSKLDKFVRALKMVDHVDKEIAKIEQEKAAFFDNNLELLCFLTDDRSERYKTARVVLAILGKPGSKNHAKEWLAEYESSIKKTLGADKLVIK